MEQPTPLGAPKEQNQSGKPERVSKSPSHDSSLAQSGPASGKQSPGSEAVPKDTAKGKEAESAKPFTVPEKSKTKEKEKLKEKPSKPVEKSKDVKETSKAVVQGPVKAAKEPPRQVEDPAPPTLEPQPKSTKPGAAVKPAPKEPVMSAPKKVPIPVERPAARPSLAEIQKEEEERQRRIAEEQRKTPIFNRASAWSKTPAVSPASLRVHDEAYEPKIREARERQVAALAMLSTGYGKQGDSAVSVGQGGGRWTAAPSQPAKSVPKSLRDILEEEEKERQNAAQAAGLARSTLQHSTSWQNVVATPSAAASPGKPSLASIQQEQAKTVHDNGPVRPHSMASVVSKNVSVPSAASPARVGGGVVVANGRLNQRSPAPASVWAKPNVTETESFWDEVGEPAASSEKTTAPSTVVDLTEQDHQLAVLVSFCDTRLDQLCLNADSHELAQLFIQTKGQASLDQVTEALDGDPLPKLIDRLHTDLKSKYFELAKLSTVKKGKKKMVKVDPTLIDWAVEQRAKPSFDV